jgi:hypothetical protein
VIKPIPVITTGSLDDWLFVTLRSLFDRTRTLGRAFQRRSVPAAGTPRPRLPYAITQFFSIVILTFQAERANWADQIDSPSHAAFEWAVGGKMGAW